jgi:hypothetical protein
MQAISQRIDGYPGFLGPLQEAARHYLKYPSVLADDGVMNIGHRPWVAKKNYMLMLYPGLGPEALDAYARRFAIQVPDMYADFLHAVNGAFCFGMSLCGVPLSMLGNPPLLDRTVLQCHDLATAATRWVSEYRVPAGSFQFGSRHFSSTEKLGYFILEGKRILGAKKSGPVISEWSTFTEFLSAELPASEKLEEELHPSRWAG